MKKLFTAILAGVLAVCGCLSLVGCGDKGTLKVGVTDYAPMDYKENGKWVGFDAELAEEVAKILGYKVEFVEIEWDNKVMSINAKEIDIIWNGMTITEDLQTALTISDPYLENNQVIVCQKTVKDNYTSKESLQNATEILVESGSAGESTVTALGFEVSGMTAQKDTLLEVKTSASKVAVIDKLMAQVLVGDGTSYSDLTFVDVGFETEQFGIGFRKEDTELCRKVNDAIRTLKGNGKFAELQAKYFG